MGVAFLNWVWAKRGGFAEMTTSWCLSGNTSSLGAQVNDYGGGRESEYSAALKTHKLLIFRDAKNAEHRKIAANWNVSGTTFHLSNEIQVTASHFVSELAQTPESTRTLPEAGVYSTPAGRSHHSAVLAYVYISAFTFVLNVRLILFSAAGVKSQRKWLGSLL